MARALRDTVFVTTVVVGVVFSRRAIFDPYTSAHEGSSQLGSIGLGLFISQKLARLMDGDLTYRHDGTHVLFELVLPRAGRAGTDD